jgi:hypothetical protein
VNEARDHSDRPNKDVRMLKVRDEEKEVPVFLIQQNLQSDADRKTGLLLLATVNYP